MFIMKVVMIMTKYDKYAPAFRCYQTLIYQVQNSLQTLPDEIGQREQIASAAQSVIPNALTKRSVRDVFLHDGQHQHNINNNVWVWQARQNNPRKSWVDTQKPNYTDCFAQFWRNPNLITHRFHCAAAATCSCHLCATSFWKCIRQKMITGAGVDRSSNFSILCISQRHTTLDQVNMHQTCLAAAAAVVLLPLLCCHCGCCCWWFCCWPRHIDIELIWMSRKQFLDGDQAQGPAMWN